MNAPLSQPQRPPRGEAAAVSHNLAGQRLGRKGQETRERILAAAMRLLEDSDVPPITLTGVARAASVRLPNLYLYFPDFGNLLLAVLRRVMDQADAGYVEHLRHFWPDECLGECALNFLREYNRFWKQHARLLHIRNAHAEIDPRILQHRQDGMLPVIQLLVKQMQPAGPEPDAMTRDIATVVLTAIERMATVVTNPHFSTMARHRGSLSDEVFIDEMIAAEARILELTIRDRREAAGHE